MHNSIDVLYILFEITPRIKTGDVVLRFVLYIYIVFHLLMH